MCAAANGSSGMARQAAPVRSGPEPARRRSGSRGQRRRARHIRPAGRLPDRRPAVPGEVLMSSASWLQIAVLRVTAPLLGRYMAKVYGDERKAPGDRVFLPVERRVYRICRVDPDSEQRWTVSSFAVIGFSLMSFLLLYAMQRLQHWLPLNPTDLPNVTDHVAFNTAVSFMTNTNWQSYSGELTMSNLTQMTGLTVQNFVSAAAGMAVMAALIRAGPPARLDARQLLGRPHPNRGADPAADVVPARARAREPRRDPELPRSHRGDHIGGCDPA